jgi:hypothetical protein
MRCRALKPLRRCYSLCRYGYRRRKSGGIASRTRYMRREMKIEIKRTNNGKPGGLFCCSGGRWQIPVAFSGGQLSWMKLFLMQRERNTAAASFLFWMELQLNFVILLMIWASSKEVDWASYSISTFVTRVLYKMVKIPIHNLSHGCKENDKFWKMSSVT